MNVFTHNSRCGRSGRHRRGQNITEYMILVAGVLVLVVVILAANSRGIFTRGVNKPLNLMSGGVDRMAKEPCLGTLDYSFIRG